MKWKTNAITLLVLLAVAAVAGATGAGEEAVSGDDEAITVNPPGTFPIVDEPITMTAFIEPMPAVEDYQDNAFTEWLAEKTNIRLEVDAPLTDAAQRRNLLLAAGDYPEIFMAGNGIFSGEEQMLYGSQGVLLPLNDLIVEYGENTRAIFDKYPTVYRSSVMPDGNIYTISRITENLITSLQMKMWIYEPFLDALDMEMPQTTAEFRDWLIAVRDGDPNGNGDPDDEIPLAGGAAWWNTGVEAFLMNAFIYTHSNVTWGTAADRLRVVDGTVDAVYDSPEWKAGLTYINGLYEDGLIAPESFVQDRNQMLQMGESPTPVLATAPAGHQGGFTNLGGESGRWLEYTAVPPLEGPGGVRLTTNVVNVGRTAYAITNKSQSPAAAFRLGDAFGYDEFILRNWLGREGTEWDWAEAGQVGITGREALFYQIVADGEVPPDARWNQVGPVWMGADNMHLLRAPAPGEDFEGEVNAVLLRESNKYLPYAASPNMVMPSVTIADPGEAAEYAELRAAINEYVNEMIARFITGDADIERTWASYLDELDTIGLPRYLELLQEAYDRYASVELN